MSGTIVRHVSGEFLLSFVVAFAFFFFMFFVNQILLLAEDVLQKDVPVWDVVLLILFSLPAIVALSVPFATLVGTLMAVGRLASENELLAIRAGGIARRIVFIPLLVLGFALAGISFVANDILLPLGTLNFGRLYRELLYSNPALELEPFSVKRYQENVLITGAVEPGSVSDFVVLDTDAQGNRRIIVAEAASLTREGDPRAIGLEMEGVISHVTERGGAFSYTSADSMRYNILLQDITVALRNPGPREMSARDVRREIDLKRTRLDPLLREWELQNALDTAALGLAAIEGIDPARNAERAARIERSLAEPPADRTLRLYRLEYHKKFAIPFGAAVFVVLAFPLGLTTRRANRGIGFGIGVLLATTYWALLIAGQTFGSQRPLIPPALAMWLPNLLFGAVGLILLVVSVRR